MERSKIPIVPCLFCGSAETYVRILEARKERKLYRVTVECRGCHAHGPSVYHQEDTDSDVTNSIFKAVEAWNEPVFVQRDDLSEAYTQIVLDSSSRYSVSYSEWLAFVKKFISANEVKMRAILKMMEEVEEEAKREAEEEAAEEAAEKARQREEEEREESRKKAMREHRRKSDRKRRKEETDWTSFSALAGSDSSGVSEDEDDLDDRDADSESDIISDSDDNK